jgi:hypothetical protein
MTSADQLAFAEARLAEEEVFWRTRLVVIGADRALRDIEFKQAILRGCREAFAYKDGSQEEAEIWREYATVIMPPLLAVWDDHPDYDQTWKPEEP